MGNVRSKNQQIAMAILDQLGGKEFEAMTGAHDFLFGEGSLVFSIGRNATEANKVFIVYEEKVDSYRMIFQNVSLYQEGFNWTHKKIKIAEYSDVFFHQLKFVFTEVTGLHTEIA